MLILITLFLLFRLYISGILTSGKYLSEILNLIELPHIIKYLCHNILIIYQVSHLFIKYNL